MSNTLKQAKRILEIVDEQDACRDQLQTLIDGGHLVHLVRAAKECRLPPLDAFIASLNGGVAPVATAPTPTAPEAEIFLLTVDARSLEQGIVAGHYDWANPDITEKRLPITVEQAGEWEARYFHFDINIESEDAKRRVEADDPANPWQVAQIGHLLTHGEKYPDEQRKFPIIALGSVAKVYGRRRVPCLDRYGTLRRLSLHWWSRRWPRRCRFLAVRKVSVPQASADAASA